MPHLRTIIPASPYQFPLLLRSTLEDQFLAQDLEDDLAEWEAASAELAAKREAAQQAQEEPQ